MTAIADSSPVSDQHALIIPELEKGQPQHIVLRPDKKNQTLLANSLYYLNLLFLINYSSKLLIPDKSTLKLFERLELKSK